MNDIEQLDEFEAAVPAAVERDDVTAACDTVLSAPTDPGAMRRLRTLPEDVRSRLAGHCVELYRTAGTQERRSLVLTAHAALLARGLDLPEGDRCHVDGRFLHVKGTLHTYKIHLGSGNILITPPSCRRRDIHFH